MSEKIEILGIQLDNDSVQEAVLCAESFLENTMMNVIGSITMEKLVLAKEEETLRESFGQLDLAIVGDKEILKAAGIQSAERLREAQEQQFFGEFMKMIVEKERSVCLLGETTRQLDELAADLKQRFAGIKLLGLCAMEACAGDYDRAVNEINVLAVDVIVSVLPTPEQEYFLMENKEKMDAKVWYSLGSDHREQHGVSYLRGLVRKIIQKEKLRSMLAKYEQERGLEHEPDHTEESLDRLGDDRCGDGPDGPGN